MTEAENNIRLGQSVDDIMVQIHLMARKVTFTTKMKTLPVSSVIQFRVLEGLMTGPMTPSEISRIHCISKPNVTTLICKLIQSGFAQRSHDEKDRRVIYVTITDKGKKVIQRKRKITKEYLLKALDQFNADEAEEIFSAMEKLRDLLIKVNNII